MSEDFYAQDGVNVKEGDAFSKIAGEACKATYRNSPFATVTDYSDGHFRGPRALSPTEKAEGCVHTFGPDGVGTKVVLNDAGSKHRWVGNDLVAMGSTDICRWGGVTVGFSSVLDVRTLGENGSPSNNAAKELIFGAKDAVDFIRTVYLNGETAELGECVGSENEHAVLMFNWAGFAYGYYHPSRMITGKRLAPGQIIKALRQDGFGSNGISSARAALKSEFGPARYDGTNNRAVDALERASAPCVLYDNFLTELNGWYGEEKRMDIHSLVHISGGGIPSKLFKDVLRPRGLGADLTDLWELPSIVEDCAEWRGMDDRGGYDTWCCGQRLFAVIDQADSDRFDKQALEHNIESKTCGEITNKPLLVIHSKFPSGTPLLYK